MPAYKGTHRPEAPVFDKDEREDIKAFYHNLAYKVNRQVINLEKMEVELRVASTIVAHHKKGVTYRGGQQFDQTSQAHYDLLVEQNWKQGLVKYERRRMNTKHQTPDCWPRAGAEEPAGGVRKERGCELSGQVLWGEVCSITCLTAVLEFPTACGWAHALLLVAVDAEVRGSSEGKFIAAVQFPKSWTWQRNLGLLPYASVLILKSS